MSNADNIIGTFIGCTLAFLMIFSIFTMVNDQPAVPRCVEDAVIVGFGEFENGYWEYYQCGPSRDDYTTR